MKKYIEVRFTKDVFLPRFNMKIGDTWKKRPENMTKEGFKLGGGFVESDRYEVINEIV